jgi:two-component system, CAI-1 autoinducer sensor kinase/phosphatase CqsS
MQKQKNRFRHYFVENILCAPLEPILDPSPRRLRFIGWAALFGQVLFGWIWMNVLPQPYDNMTLRLVAASLGIILLLKRVSDVPDAKATEWLFGLIVWFELPVLFSWMYLQNPFSQAWFGSVVAMILLYYQTTDWRLATIGLLSAIGLGVAGTYARAGHVALANSVSADECFVIFFAWSMAVVFAMSSANIRRKRLENALTTMGILAHELRTPLATLSLLGDALRGQVSGGESGEGNRLADIAWRIFSLARAMNQQIDMQIANASLMRLSPNKDSVHAIEVVQLALAQYPFRSQRERESMQLDFKDDFAFKGSQRLFVQVLLNLLKNAMRAVAALQTPLEKPGICIEVSRSGASGIIQVTDFGVGIASHLLRRIFEPFFSTQSDTGHGLGLAFCRTVVRAAGGKIHAASIVGVATTFTIMLPIAAPTHVAHTKESNG